MIYDSLLIACGEGGVLLLHPTAWSGNRPKMIGALNYRRIDSFRAESIRVRLKDTGGLSIEDFGGLSGWRALVQRASVKSIYMSSFCSARWGATINRLFDLSKICFPVLAI